MKKASQAKTIFITILLAFCSHGVAGGENGRRKLQLSVAGGTGNPPPEMLPLGECVGDCDSDGDCDVDLICFQRNATEEVPGCDGGAEDVSLTDYCIVPPTAQPSATPTMTPTMTPSNSPTASPTAAPSTAPTSAASIFGPSFLSLSFGVAIIFLSL